MSTHNYRTSVIWTGNAGPGTTTYKSYSRAHEIRTGEKHVILGSSDPQFRGDAQRWNPEELLVASLSSCHMLWYLHLCAEAGVVVSEYVDDAEGFMADGAFARVVLRPVVQITAGGAEFAGRLHTAAHERCFIASSVKFPVECEASVVEREVSALQP